MITKLLIRWKMRSFQVGLNSIDLELESLSDLVRWNRNFAAFLSQLYPSGSDLATALSRVLVYAPQHYYRAVDPTAVLTSPTVDHDKAADPIRPLTRLDYKLKYRDEYQNILNELRSTVSEQGVPPGFKPPTWHEWVVTITVGVVTAFLTASITYYSTERDSAERATERAQDVQRQAVVGVSDLYRLLRNYDTHFQNEAFDSAVNSIRQRVGVESGLYITGMIEFAEDARRKRDASIDSAIVRLRQLGVDTDTLRFSKRLPIRMGQALKRRAQALGLDAGVINSVLRRDSL